MMLPKMHDPETNSKVIEDKPGHRATSRVPGDGDYRRFYILVLLYILCTVFYYFGELIDFFGWEALRWNFFYSVHDVHRLFFLAPIIYAGYFFGIRASIITTLIAINTFLPRALFISPFPDPLLRTVLFIIIAGAIGYLTGRESEHRRRLEALVRGEREQILGILNRIEDGAFIVAPDYRIRFTNPSIARDFGQGVGSPCYKYLHKSDNPCLQICKLPSVTKGALERWEYSFPDGKIYEVRASPYIDSDGIVCQLVILKNITPHKKSDL